MSDAHSTDAEADAGTAPATGTRLDDAALDRLRPLSFTVAYRMLGSVAEAEDVVQEALTRIAQADDVRNPDAFVTTVTTRIAIDVLRSARVRRESYTGDWLPEPLVGSVPSMPVAMATPPVDAAAHAELADDLSTAFLVLLETLTPTERAAFLLHDVLGFPHSEAAAVIGTTDVAARQLASRARRRIEQKRNAGARSSDQPSSSASGSGSGPASGSGAGAGTGPGPGPGSSAGTGTGPGAGTASSAARADELVARFLAACEEGEVDPFLEILAEDVVITSDSGGKVPRGLAISRPVVGRDHVVRLLSGWVRQNAPAHFEHALLGGEPGLVIVADDAVGGGVIGTWSLEIAHGRIVAIRGVINPEKLTHVGPLADLDRVKEYFTEVRAERTDRRRDPGRG